MHSLLSLWSVCQVRVGSTRGTYLKGPFAGTSVNQSINLYVSLSLFIHISPPSCLSLSFFGLVSTYRVGVQGLTFKFGFEVQLSSDLFYIIHMYAI